MTPASKDLKSALSKKPSWVTNTLFKITFPSKALFSFLDSYQDFKNKSLFNYPAL